MALIAVKSFVTVVFPAIFWSAMTACGVSTWERGTAGLVGEPDVGPARVPAALSDNCCRLAGSEASVWSLNGSLLGSSHSGAAFGTVRCRRVVTPLWRSGARCTRSMCDRLSGSGWCPKGRATPAHLGPAVVVVLTDPSRALAGSCASGRVLGSQVPQNVRYGPKLGGADAAYGFRPGRSSNGFASTSSNRSNGPRSSALAAASASSIWWFRGM